MSGKPKECRERAAECMELARNARSPDHKTLLTGLAQSWLNLAVDIERSAAFSAHRNAGEDTGRAA
jgi:hypothetical protein